MLDRHEGLQVRLRRRQIRGVGRSKNKNERGDAKDEKNEPSLPP